MRLSGTRHRATTASRASRRASIRPAHGTPRDAAGRGSIVIWRNWPVSSPNETTGGRTPAGVGATGTGRGAKRGSGTIGGGAAGAGAGARGTTAGAGGGAAGRGGATGAGAGGAA